MTSGTLGGFLKILGVDGKLHRQGPLRGHDVGLPHEDELPGLVDFPVGLDGRELAQGCRAQSVYISPCVEVLQVPLTFLCAVSSMFLRSPLVGVRAADAMPLP
jgi:hypothetical protein